MNFGFSRNSGSNNLSIWDGDSIFGKEGNGTLDLILVKDVQNWPKTAESNGIWLDISIWYDDLNAIHRSALAAKLHEKLDDWTIEMIQNDYESFEREYHRNRGQFVSEFPECPILGSDYDMYDDYIFDLEKTRRFQDECLRIKELPLSKKAARSLQKLLYACNSAIRENSYLVFACD